MEPHHTIPNMMVKRYSGEDTSEEILWENSTMPKFNLITIFLFFLLGIV